MKNRISEEQLARRVARELQDGFCVNLGIGMPMMVASYIPPGVHILVHSENGVLGVGATIRDSLGCPERAPAS